MNKTLRGMTMVGTALLATITFAQESGNPPSYARNQAIQGRQGPSNGNQAPDGQGGMGRRGPPPEAVSACAGKNQETPCSFVTPRGNAMDGTCRQVPEGQFACVPKNNRGPGGPGGQGGNSGGDGRRMKGGAQDGMPPRDQ